MKTFLEKNKIILLFLVSLLILSVQVIAVNPTTFEVFQNSSKVEIVNLGDTTQITFASDDSYVEIGKALFKGIRKNSLDSVSKIVIDNNNGEITSADFKVGSEGRYFTFGKNKIYAPANSRVKLEKDVITILPEDGSVFEALPSVLEDSSGKTYEVRIEGNDLKLKEDFKLDSGQIVFKGNDMFVMTGSKINSIEIKKEYGKNDFEIQLFLDGEKHEINKNYISINSLERKLYLHIDPESSKSLEFSLNFLKGNSIIQINEKNFFSISPRDVANLELLITNPSDSIPNIEISTSDKNARVQDFILDGKRIFMLSHGRFVALASEKSSREELTPVSIGSKDGELFNKDSVFIVDRNGIIYLIDRDSSSKFTSLDYQYPKINSEGIKTLQELFPNIIFSGNALEDLTDIEISRLQQAMEKIPKEVQESLKTISFIKPLSMKEAMKGSLLVDGTYYYDRMEIEVNVPNGKDDALIHEFGHAFSALLMNLPAEYPDESKFIAFKDKINELIQEYNKNNNANAPLFKVEDLSYDKGFTIKDYHVLNPYRGSLSSAICDLLIEDRFSKKENSFFEQWAEIQGKDTYFSKEELARMKTDSEYARKVMGYWEDGSMGPKNGFMHPYAKLNVVEDFAEFFRVYYANPELMSKMIDSNDRLYNEKVKAKYDLFTKTLKRVEKKN